MNDTLRILLVDDEVDLLDTLGAVLARHGNEVATATDGAVALERLSEAVFDLVIADIKMPNVDGMELLERIKESTPDTDVVLITGYGDVRSAVTAIKAGAYDYIIKPASPEELLLLIGRLKEMKRLTRENIALKRELGRGETSRPLVGKHPSMLAVGKLIEDGAQADSTILVRGESGTGKELVAHAIHHQSPRATGPFVKVNCAILSETLLESELFGHENGAFTGAVATKKGRFELADRGTLFLDEIGDISPLLQTKLLRVLQEGEFEAVGGIETKKVDVRIVAATSRNLEAAVDDGEYRADLYYRLNVIPVKLPPLRERKEDIPLLVPHVLATVANRLGHPVPTIEKSAFDVLTVHDWPGNVRELENCLERAVVLGKGKPVALDDLPDAVREPDGSPTDDGLDGRSLDEAVADVEKHLIVRTLDEHGGNRSQAARALKMHRTTLLSKMEKYGLS